MINEETIKAIINNYGGTITKNEKIITHKQGYQVITHIIIKTTNDNINNIKQGISRTLFSITPNEFCEIISEDNITAVCIAQHIKEKDKAIELAKKCCNLLFDCENKTYINI